MLLSECRETIAKVDFLTFFVIVITFYSPIWFGQETAKGLLGLRIQPSPAYLSTTQGGVFTLPLLMLNVKQESCKY